MSNKCMIKRFYLPEIANQIKDLDYDFLVGKILSLLVFN